MRIIPPESLAADAIVPQCLDNQYASDRVLDAMLSSSPTRGYSDTEIARLRLEDTHTEFVRSLLYCSTVVVNRAYLVNSDYLVQELGTEAATIPALMQSGAIVPYLQTEHSLTEEAAYAQNRGALDTLKRLEDKGAFDNCACVRFSPDDSANLQTVETLGARFRQFAADLGNLPDDAEFARVARGLYLASGVGSAIAEGEVPEEVLSDFSGQLQACSRFIPQKLDKLRAEKKRFGRQHLYEHFFIANGDASPQNVERGLFHDGMKRPALRMFKKLVDLKYNANLPDLLSRYTLTPADLPGRSLLPYPDIRGGITPQGAFTSLQESLARIKSSVMDEKPEVLPRLRKLNLCHIAEIRKFDEWEAYRRSQESLLSTDTPENLVQSLDGYTRTLEQFQSRLAYWALQSAPDSLGTARRYKTAVNLVVRFGIVTVLVALSPHREAAGILGLAAEAALDLTRESITKYLEEHHVAETIKGWSVKLMVDVHDTASLLRDRDHSFQIELIRSNALIHRKEAIQLVEELQRSTRMHAASNLQIAEQSRE